MNNTLPSIRLAFLATLLLLASNLLAGYARGALVHHYTFDSGANDSVGVADGILTNGAQITTVAAEVEIGAGAMKLDGSNDHTVVPVINYGNNFTIAAWVLWNSSPTVRHTIFANRGSGATTQGFHWYIDRANSRMILENSDGSAQDPAIGTVSSLSAGTYHHVALTVDRTAGIGKFYIDGVLDPTSDTSITTTFNNSGQIGYIGDAITANALNGFIDDVRIYNTTLTAGQVAALIPEPSTTVMVASLLLFGCPLIRRRLRR